MPNKNYVKGRRKEYKICKELKEQGYDIVQRSAGSHSPVDVFAFRKSDRKVLLVQCKPDGYSSSKYDEFRWLNDDFKVRFKIR